jgi:CheY-like chemotaxis protein
MVAESTLNDSPPYDVILMDYYMPVMNGPEAVNLIRGQGYLGVILAVTGASSDSEFSALLGQGVDRILVKPFNLDEFKRAYREVKRGNILAEAAAEMV